MEGDKYDRKGALSGGYHDDRRSRLDAVKHVKQWQSRFDDESKQLLEVKTQLAKLDQEITQIVGQIQVVEGKRNRIQRDREAAVQAAVAAQQEEDRARTRVGRLEAGLNDQQSNIRNLKAEIEAYNSELKTKMTQSLSDAEVQQMSDFNDEVDQLQKDLVALSKSTVEVRLSSHSFNPFLVREH